MARIIKTDLDEVHGKRAADRRVRPGFYCAAVIEDPTGRQAVTLIDVPDHCRSIASMQAWCAGQVGRLVSSWRVPLDGWRPWAPHNTLASRSPHDV